MAPPLPETPPLCITGGTLLTLDERATVLRDNDLLIRDGRIAAVGKRLALPADVRRIDGRDHLVLPGLVQGHVHLGQTLFRGLAEERRLLAWLRERIWPLEAAHDDGSARASALLGAAELLLGGTTTVQEIGLGPGVEGLLEGIAESGLRAVAGKCLMDTGEGMPAGLAEPASRTLTHAVRLGEVLDRSGNGRLRPVLNPRFALSCSEGLWREIATVARDKGWPVHTHALEQREETRAVRALFGGRDEIEAFHEFGILEQDLRVAHGVWIRGRHLPRLAAGRFGVVHCPSSNLKLGSGIAPVARLRRAGIPVGVGADGAPCNNRLDGWTEIRLASQLAALRGGPGSLPGLEALRLATSEGARVLGLEREIGSLEIGKRADVVVLELADPSLVASEAADPHDLVAFGASPAAVRHVAIDGELLVEDRRLTRLDLRRIRSDAQLQARVLLDRARL
ncbi:MAG: amidohydrolase family protein [Thermoanaerobaculia bacterium]